MAFKMKGSFLYGSPMKKNKPTYEEAWNNMKSYQSKRGKFKDNMARGGTVYTDNEFGRAEFINDAKLYNAKQKNKNVARVEPKKPTVTTGTKKTMKTVAEPKTKTKKKFKDTKVGKFLSKKRTNQPRKKYNPRLNRFE
jgi:hypothetical protein